MDNLDKFFPSGVSATAHPKLRSWGPLIQDPQVQTECEVLRKYDGFSYSPPKLYIHHKRVPSGDVQTDQDDWDDTLNAYLVQNGVRAVSPENEAIRFCLMLRRLFHPLEVRFGEGYFNAVIVQVVNDNFGSVETITGLLRKIGEHRPYKGASYQDAVKHIEDAILQCAVSLTSNLKYDRPGAEKILIDAIAAYLVERFSLNSLWLKGFV